MREPYFSQKLQNEQQHNSNAPIGSTLGAGIKERECTPIGDALSQIDRQIESFWSDSGGLESALQPILRPAVKTDRLGVPCDPPQSPLHESLLAICIRLEAIRENLAEIRNRITL